MEWQTDGRFAQDIQQQQRLRADVADALITLTGQNTRTLFELLYINLNL